MALTQSEIYTLARSVGLTDSRAKTAAAVAMAESKGDPNAHNATPPDDSYGLWQINMLGSMGPSRRQQFGISANTDLYNPQTNAKAMKSISQDGGNFNAWSTYTNQSYRQYLGNTVADQSSSPGWLDKLGRWIAGTPIVSPVTSTTGALVALADATKKTGSWVSNSRNWIRVGFVVGGAIVTIAGLVMVVESTKTGRALTGAAATITPPGRVASAVKKGAS